MAAACACVDLVGLADEAVRREVSPAARRLVAEAVAS
jgi:hypothetical protein